MSDEHASAGEKNGHGKGTSERLPTLPSQPLSRDRRKLKGRGTPHEGARVAF
jgi:hypothetical protein